MSLRGKVALVTGAARRVGRGIAFALARAGASVAIHYHTSDQEALETLDLIRRPGIRAEAIRADLADPDEIRHLFNAVQQTFGRLDILVNSASAFTRRGFLDLSLEEWDAGIAVNLRAPFLCSQRAARLMLSQEITGSIINIADTIGERPWASYPEHAISNAGLLMLTRVSAKALAPNRIRVNAVIPGPVLRPSGMPDERWKQIVGALPLPHQGDGTAYVAQAVLSLVQNEFITGAALHVDGGEGLLDLEDLIR
ncbi:MAG: SDR family oxidoreductase [Anaerolineae bacterium]|nr:SDR family oxidoreductase [Anaerolineae bacterium]